MKTETKTRVSNDPKDYKDVPVGWMVKGTYCRPDGLWTHPATGKTMIKFCDDKPPYRDEISVEAVYV